MSQTILLSQGLVAMCAPPPPTTKQTYIHLGCFGADTVFTGVESDEGCKVPQCSWKTIQCYADTMNVAVNPSNRARDRGWFGLCVGAG